VRSELDPDAAGEQEKMGKAMMFNRCRQRWYKSTAAIANPPMGIHPTTTAWNRKRASRVQVDVRRRDSPVEHGQRAFCVGRSSGRTVPLHKQRFLILIELGSSCSRHLFCLPLFLQQGVRIKSRVSLQPCSDPSLFLVFSHRSFLSHGARTESILLVPSSLRQWCSQPLPGRFVKPRKTTR
jgi:hypothetical protein